MKDAKAIGCRRVRLHESITHLGIALNPGAGIPLNQGIRDIRSLTEWQSLRY
jgi:hypothetical protein